MLGEGLSNGWAMVGQRLVGGLLPTIVACGLVTSSSVNRMYVPTGLIRRVLLVDMQNCFQNKLV